MTINENKLKMSYGTCIGCLRKTSLNSSAYCSACQVSQSVKNSSKGDSSGDGDLFAFMSEITFPLIVLFFYFEINKWFFLFDKNWLNYLTTFIAAYIPLYLLKRSFKRGNKQVTFILLFLNIFSLYLIVDTFVVALPFVTIGDGS
jgi:hypothetical protein